MTLPSTNAETGPNSVAAPLPGKAAGGNQILWVIANFEEVVTAIILAVMIASVGLGVFFRFVVDQPVNWVEEVVLLLMVWLCFLGASVVTKHKEHITIEFFVDLMPKPLAKGMRLVTLLAIIALLAMLTWQGFLLLEVTQDVTTTALNIPTMYMYAAIPVGCLLMLIHNLRHLYAILRGRSSGG